MEDNALREKCNLIIGTMKEKLYRNKKCIAAYLLGSFSHDQIWEWSDIQLELVFDDGYKGKMHDCIYENGRNVVLNIHTLTNFKAYINKVNADDYLWKAFSKSTKLFSKDFSLDELFEEAFYIGDADKEKEMLLGFSGAVYYLNKAEKNFYIKENLENTIYFIPLIAENIAWIEIFKKKQIPEREIIPQGKQLNPALFSEIYDPLYQEKVNHGIIKEILDNCINYLNDNTKMVYRPILQYLESHGNLEGFQYETRLHGFGINYEWLVRYGLAERYGIPEKVPFLDKEIYRTGYRSAE